MVTFPLGSSVMAAIKDESRGMLAMDAMAVRRATTTLGADTRSAVCRPPRFTEADTTMGGKGGRELEGVGVGLADGEAPTVTLGVGVCEGVRVTLALGVSVRLGRAVRVTVTEPVTVPVADSEAVPLPLREAKALWEASEAEAETEAREGVGCALALACDSVAASEALALGQAVPLAVSRALAVADAEEERVWEALGEADAQGHGVGEELRLEEALGCSDEDSRLENEAEAVELSDGVGLEDGLVLPEAAADTLGQEALALREASEGVESTLAQAEEEGCETLACWDCVLEVEVKEEGLVLGPWDTVRDSEALLEEEGDAWLGVPWPVAEAERVACEGEPWEVADAVSEAAPLVLALGHALGVRDAAALAVGDKEASEAVPGAVAETEGEDCREALPQGLLEDDKVGDREELALPEEVSQAETEGLPDAVGEALCREALG